MSLRHVSIVTGLLLTLGGAVALASRPQLFQPSLAQAGSAPTNSADSSPSRRQWLQDLNLSSDQIQQLRKIRTQYRNQISSNDQQLQQTRQDLRNLLVGTASTDQIRAKHHEVETLRQQVSDLRFESLLAMREVLTPEQRQKFAQHMQQRQEARQGWRERRNTPAPGDGSSPAS